MTVSTSTDPAEAAATALRIRQSVDLGSARALRAMIALGAVALTTGLSVLLGLVGLAPLLGVVWWAGNVAYLAAAIFYLMWLHRAYRNAPDLGAMRIEMSPADAVWSFFIPIVNLFRPYQAISTLYAVSDPTLFPDAPIYREVHDGGYRQSALEALPTPRWDYPFPIKLWWGLWLLRAGGLIAPMLGGSLGGMISALAWVAIVMRVIDAVLAIAVVKAIDARQRERLRRLEARGLVVAT